ncbi:MAG: nucleoside triphosphate pyrophosphohydrolase [Candidatus Hinthialibacteria bacterium]|nr:nucleoside triphosphate pyrophosphohydrolase [bacterium]MCE7908731.1 nucleoside triphosphate pyrophosphohydrolase [Candidatus Omnitrophica bacterium COP1]
MTGKGQCFEKLCEIMHRLRSPGGCPWDREQTHSSLIKYLIEESYEVAEAIQEGDDPELVRELGDVLLQVVFHSEIASQEGRFTVEDVLQAICHKMIERHPHVFGDARVEDSDAVLKQWEQIKKKERGEDSSILEGIPKTLPALLRAERLQSRAAKVGFDWDHPQQIIEKIEEELSELKESLSQGQDRIEEELGDLLFTVVNLARFLKMDPENALQECNGKFIQRFQHIEERLRSQGSSVEKASLAEMDALWTDAKSAVKRR